MSEEAERRRRATLSPLSLLESEIKFFFRESNSFHNDNDENTPEASIREQKRRESRRFCYSARARVFARASSEMRSLLYCASFSIFLNLFYWGKKERVISLSITLPCGRTRRRGQRMRASRRMRGIIETPAMMTR